MGGPSVGDDLSKRVSIKRSLSFKPSDKLSRGNSPSKRHPHQEEQQEDPLITWDTSGARLLRILTQTRGKLGNFVSLNTNRLEEKLLAEQERQMALEQQELLAEWAAPSRRATEAPENSHRQSRSLSHAGSHLSNASHVRRHVSSTHRASMYGVHDEQELSTPIMSHRSLEGSQYAQGADYESPPSFILSPDSRRPCRPDIIQSRSTRLVELVNMGQQQLALMAAAKGQATHPHSSDAKFSVSLPPGVELGAELFSSPRQSKLSVPGPARELFGNKALRNSVSQLQGCALASQALVTIKRAERLLEKLKENASLDDSRPGTSEGELRMYEQQLQMLRDASSTMIDVPDEEDHTGEPFPTQPGGTLSRTKSRRQTAVYIKGLDRSSMLFNAHALTRAASKRHGVAGPKSLAMSFVEQITKLDEYSLVEAAKHRLVMMQECERMLSAADDRASDEKEAAHQLGLMLAEQLLQELQQRVQGVSKDSKTTPDTAAATNASQVTMQSLEALGIEMPDSLETYEAEDKLTNLRNAYGTIRAPIG